MIEIIRTNNQGLTRKTYQFFVRAEDFGNNAKIVVQFDRYIESSRPSRRHRNWIDDARWYWNADKGEHRYTTTGKPELPEDVQEELKIRVHAATQYKL